MEQLLIQGGAQYLPFARSRIQAMRAAGLTSGHQKFVVDGVTIIVELLGELDRIRISGSSTIEMDSGVVSAPYSAGLGQTYIPGTLQDTRYTQLYNAAFTKVAGTRKLNPNTGTEGQISGKLSGGSPIKGSIPFNDQKAISFSPGKISDGKTPPSLIDNPKDDYLLGKKQMGHNTPASHFTGKTRLYVQAMYGRPLYSGNATTPNPTPQSAGPLGLTLAGYKEGPSVTIDTSTGVWLDPATRKHWLFVVADLAVHVYPLIATPAGEALRHWLSSTTFSQDTKDKLEAYILSTCLPDSKNVQVLTKPTTGTMYCMGYGWHWSWTLGRADIVVMTTFWAGGFLDNIGQESRRYSLQMTAVTGDDGVTKFSCAQALVEGPSRWVIKRNTWVLVEPDFGAGVMTKTTSAGGQTDRACSGPFYVFYKRDELQVCRITVTAVVGTDERSTLDTWFRPWDGYWQTEGDGSADAKDLIASAYYFVLTISIGSKQYTDLHFSDVKSGQGWKIDVQDNFGPPSAGSTAFGTGSSTYNMFFGSDTNHDPFHSNWEVTPTYYGPAYGAPGAIAKNNGSLHFCRATREHNITTISNNSLAVVMVPAGDAEAVYVNTQKWTLTERITRNITISDQYAFFENQTVFFGDGSFIQKTRTLWFDNVGGFGSTPNTGDASSSTPVTLVNELVCNAGTVQTIFSPTNDFYDASIDDIVGGLYTSICSVNGAAIAQGMLPPTGVGLNEAPPLFPIMVGWA